MADNLDEAIELVVLYVERTEEQNGGLLELKETLENWAAQMAETLGSNHESVHLFATAASATDVVQGLMGSALSELQQLQQTLESLK